jgi:hypothetical protein
MPPMAAFMAVELTRQYRLFPWHCCRAVSRDLLRKNFKSVSLHHHDTSADVILIRKRETMSTPIVGSEPNIGLIIRERDPLNLEYPFDQLDEFLTPNDLFYIRR